MLEVSVLQFKGVEKREGDAIWIPRFDLAIGQGEIVAVQSNLEIRNHLIKSLLGKRVFTNGTIELFGELLHKPSPERVGFVFTDEGFYERLSVKDHLMLYKRLYTSSLRIEEVLPHTKLNGILHKSVNQLTFSEKRRLALARVLLQNPDFVILEEPDQNIDLETKEVTIDWMEKLQEEGKALLVFTHHLESARAFTEKVYRIHRDGIEDVSLFTEDEPLSFSPIKVHKVSAKLEDKLVLFDPSEIDYFESQQGQVVLFGEGEAYPCPSTLADLEKRLTSFGFFRCHRSYLVNLQRVREIVTWSKNSYSLNLSDPKKSQIPLSKNKLGELKELLTLS
ncbi:LytR family transcriptional regulator [Halobacillus fulvus]|nr:LytR family transcriptional regulator [Halobacillus fulvus]